MPVICRITSRRMMLQLPLNVIQQTAGAEAEELCLHPVNAEFLFHQSQPFGRLLGGANAACRFKADCHAGLLSVFPDGSSHDKTYGQRSVRRLFARRGLDEVSPSHHGNEASASNIARRQQIARPQDDFHVSWTARLLEGCNLIVKLLPSAAENVRTCNDHI